MEYVFLNGVEFFELRFGIRVYRHGHDQESLAVLRVEEDYEENRLQRGSAGHDKYQMRSLERQESARVTSSNHVSLENTQVIFRSCCKRLTQFSMGARDQADVAVVKHLRVVQLHGPKRQQGWPTTARRIYNTKTSPKIPCTQTLTIKSRPGGPSQAQRSPRQHERRQHLQN